MICTDVSCATKHEQESGARLDAFLNRTEDGTFYVGHATVLARFDGKLILIDPVCDRPLFLDSWLFFPPLALSSRLFDVDAVLISHCHEDHYDPNFLGRLKNGTPIFITEGCTGLDRIEQDPSFNTIRLKRNAFTDVVQGVRAFAIPSDHNDFDSSFIVRSDTFAVFQGNDNFVSREVMEGAAAVAGPVDHAYIPYSYVWWYPFCLTSMPEDEREAEAQRLTRRNMKIGEMMADVLNARHIIPSAGNLVLCDHANSVVNRGIATPFDYAEFEHEQCGSASSRVAVLVAGDYILEVDGGSEIVAQGYDKDVYFRKMDEFLTEYNRHNPAPGRTSPITPDTLENVRARLASAPRLEQNHLIAVRRADCLGETIAININDRTVDLVKQVPTADAVMVFDLQPAPFEQWVAGEISFETVLNSQRFSVFREPEQFYEPAWRVLRTLL